MSAIQIYKKMSVQSFIRISIYIHCGGSSKILLFERVLLYFLDEVMQIGPNYQNTISFQRSIIDCAHLEVYIYMYK